MFFYPGTEIYTQALNLENSETVSEGGTLKKFSESTHRGTLAELNITPLLDLVFVLLVIFMITTPLMEQQIGVRLPTSSPQPSQEIELSRVRQVTIDASGAIHFDQAEVSLATLKAELARFKKSEPEGAVALRADQNLRYQNLVDVLDAIRASGLKLGLATSPFGHSTSSSLEPY